MRRLLLLCAFAAAASAQAPTLKAALTKAVTDGDVAGAVAIVGTKSNVLGLEVAGKRDLAAGDAMTDRTLFRIASMTKPVTALGIMILQDRGKLTVADPVEKYLPEFKGQMLVKERGKDTVTLTKPARPITLKDLLTHTSGLPGSYPIGMADVYATRKYSLAETIFAQSQRPLDFPPGTKWSYCNAGIDTLGRVIEVVSGKSYEQFLTETIYTPLGMADTTFVPKTEDRARVATVYAKKDGALSPVPTSFLDAPLGSRHPVPAGGLYSTAADLANLYASLLNGGEAGGTRIVSAESLAEMTKVQTGDIKTGFVDGMAFGYGFAVVKEPKGVTEMLKAGAYGHGGAFGTQAWLDPAQGFYAVLLIARVGIPNADGNPLRGEIQKAAVALAVSK